MAIIHNNFAGGIMSYADFTGGALPKDILRFTDRDNVAYGDASSLKYDEQMMLSNFLVIMKATYFSRLMLKIVFL